MNATERALAIAECLTRHSTRFDRVMKMPRVESITIDGQERILFMPAHDRKLLNDWFNARFIYLEAEYREALTVIGKDPDKAQWWRAKHVVEEDWLVHR